METKNIKYMKSIKTMIIIAGIVTAIIALLSMPAHAGSGGEMKQEKSIEHKSMLDELYARESALIENYLDKISVKETIENQTEYLLYDSEGQLLYKGTTKPTDNQFALLMAYEGQRIYLKL